MILGKIRKIKTQNPSLVENVGRGFISMKI